MLGLAIGDVTGSELETLEVEAFKTTVDKIRSYKDRVAILDEKRSLFTGDLSYTDDTTLSVAIMDALLHDKDYEKYLKEYGLKEIDLGLDKYGRSRFGKGFVNWLQGLKEGDSYGNGGAMRVAPIAYYFDDLETILEEVKKATIPSHNHEEAIIGAQATASAIYMSRMNYSKEEIKSFIEETFHYNLDFSLEDLQHNYRFSARAKDSVPEAIYCFLVSTSFEDCIRKSLSIGGDTDTIAAIAGGIAESYYGIPKNLINEVRKYIPTYMLEIIDKFYQELENKKNLPNIQTKKKFYEKS